MPPAHDAVLMLSGRACHPRIWLSSRHSNSMIGVSARLIPSCGE
jgi:hypothetical protein